MKTVPYCSYCRREAEFLSDSKEVYHGRDYGPIWICRPCQAWVGVHRGTANPLGRLATKELRQAKMAAHAAFDPLWKGEKAEFPSRSSAYKQMAEWLQIDKTKAHIGMLDVDQCYQLVKLIKENDKSHR